MHPDNNVFADFGAKGAENESQKMRWRDERQCIKSPLGTRQLERRSEFARELFGFHRFGSGARLHGVCAGADCSRASAAKPI